MIVLLIAAVLFPMWFVALYSGGATEPVRVSANSTIAPTGGFVQGPTDVGPNPAGVISWVALFALGALIIGTTRMIRRVGRMNPRREVDESSSLLPSYLLVGKRRLVEYYDPPNDRAGLIVLGLLSWSTVVFSVLLVLEGMNLARTQFLGVYAGLAFISLGEVLAVYYAWFVPSITVAEDRAEHGAGD